MLFFFKRFQQTTSKLSFYRWEVPSTSLFKSGPIAGKSVSHGPTFAGEQWISTGTSAFCMSSINAS